MNVKARIFGEIAARGSGESVDNNSDLMSHIADGAGQTSQPFRAGQAYRGDQHQAQTLVQQDFRDELRFKVDTEIGAAADGAKMAGHDSMSFVKGAPYPLQRNLPAISLKGPAQSIRTLGAHKSQIAGAEDVVNCGARTLGPLAVSREKAAVRLVEFIERAERACATKETSPQLPPLSGKLERRWKPLHSFSAILLPAKKYSSAFEAIARLPFSFLIARRNFQA